MELMNNFEKGIFMGAFYAMLNDLRPGIVISESIYINTAHPIIKKDTIMTAEHLEVLHAFGVRKVKVNNTVIKKEESLDENGVAIVNPEDILAEIHVTRLDFEEEYNQAVTDFKKEFISWQSGTQPDITKIRSIIIPFLEKFNEHKDLLSLLGDHSNSLEYKYHHPIAVGIIASAISKKMGFPIGQTLQVGLAGVLANCGMAKIDEKIIGKTDFLTKDEFNEVKKHVVYSYQLVQDTALLRPEMKQAIFQHHERLDGSGYPQGVKVEKISVYSQVLAVADVFHAIISERVYRSKESPFKAVEMIKEEEFGKFDIKVVQALHDIVCNLSIGTQVRLTNGKEGKVIFVHRDAALRPTIRMNEDESILDLTSNRRLAIERVL